jgi:rhamnogalacturonyl hydrolase YesR
MISLLLAVLALRVPGAAAEGGIESAIGVTHALHPIRCVLDADDLDLATRKTRILLVGAAPREAESIEAALGWFRTARAASRYRSRFALSAVPNTNPDGSAILRFPPPDPAYKSDVAPEAAYLWRWIGMHAPDLVVEVRAGERAAWSAPEPATELRRFAVPHPPGDDLVSQLVRVAPSDTGTIPALLATVPSSQPFLPALLAELERVRFAGPSPARRELQARLDRTPEEVARQLAKRYGHDLEEAVYIPAVALIGRLRLGELADVERIVSPYFTGAKPSLGTRPTGSHLSVHLLFGELYRLTQKPRYLELARAAADLGFDAAGLPLESMPLHDEMSDSVFMGCPILALVGRLSGDGKYFDQCLRHLKFMMRLDLRPDGLYRHSPLDESAWGRGNGFPALGLALSLDSFPERQAGRDELLRAFRAHMTALLKHQDPTGAWHQVIDVPSSYRELTATCMIAFAAQRGVRAGWLDRATFQPAIDRAWYAIRTRVARDGALVDVCTGTGKQKSFRDYLDRAAILGPDPRGGAMALLIATELARPTR